MHLRRALLSTALLVAPFGTSAGDGFRIRPRAPVVALPPAPETPDAAWALALGQVWSRGLVQPDGPARLGWTADEAVAAAVALEDGRDRRDAFAAWVVGEGAWAEATARADERLALTGEDLWAGEELPLRERRAILDGWRATTAHAELYTLQWPIAGPGRISSRFGPRRHPILGVAHTHAGIDLSVPVGTPVLAAQDGVVVSTGEGPASGRFVILDHGGGLSSRYYHLDAAVVRRGDRLVQGETLGRSGRTGRATGPHLHFEVRLRGRVLDPEPLRDTRSVAPGA